MAPRVLARFAGIELRGEAARAETRALSPRQYVGVVVDRWERTSVAEFLREGVWRPGRYNRSIWEMRVSQSLGGDAYLSMPKHNTHYRAGIGCLDRSTGSVYTVARCGCHSWGRNRVFGQSRYVTCKTRRPESDATEKTRVIARDKMAAVGHVVVVSRRWKGRRSSGLVADSVNAVR